MAHWSTITGIGIAGLAPTVIQAVEQTAPQNQVVIEDIVIQGCQSIHPDRVLFRLRSRVGRPLSAADIAEDVRTINTMGPFIDGRSQIEYLDERRVRLIFTVTELPLIGQIRFDGLNFFTRQGLADKIRSKPGEHRNPLAVEADRRFLIENFRKKSFVNATVTTSENIDPSSGLVELIFHVDRGTPVKVAKTLYPDLPEGAHKYFLDKELLFNAKGRPYNPDMVDLDGKIVVNALQDLGYLDAQLDDIVATFYDDVAGYEQRRRHGPFIAPDGKRFDRVVIGFETTAGERYRLGDIRFVGNTVLSETELRAMVDVAKGDWFLRKEISSELNGAQRHLRNLGYARAGFRIDRSYDIENRRVDLTVHVFEGTTYRFGRVDLDGNTVTKDAAIRRLIDARPGDAYTQDAVDESRRQIGRTGLFTTSPPNKLRINPRFPAERPKEVDLEISLEEAHTGSLNASAGYVTGSGLVGQLEYSERNFDLLGLVTEGRMRGAGQTVNANISFSDERLSTSLSWLNPHLWDSSYFLRTNFVLRKDEDSTLAWDEDRIMSSISIGRYFLNRDIQLSLGYRYTDLTIKNVDPTDAADDVIAGHYYDNLIYADQRMDRTNSRVLPTRGWSLDLHQGVSGQNVSASYHYYEITADGHAFLPLLEGDLGGVTFLHLRQKNRWLRGLDGDDVPFYHRYYGGGPYPRHRGFDRNRLGPREINSAGFEVRPGGTTEWLTTLELSFPVQGTNEGIRVIAFYDYGWIWGADEQFDLGDSVQAAGFGLRFPISFPIALDFAWLLDDVSGEDRQQVHFSLGSMLF